MDDRCRQGGHPAAQSRNSCLGYLRHGDRFETAGSEVSEYYETFVITLGAGLQFCAGEELAGACIPGLGVQACKPLIFLNSCNVQVSTRWVVLDTVEPWNPAGTQPVSSAKPAVCRF